MAIVKASTEVQAALNRLADRYAAMATKCEPPERVTLVLWQPGFRAVTEPAR
jgi:hypothetical protein